MDTQLLLDAISNMLDQKLDEKLTPIIHRLDTVEQRLDTIDQRLDAMDQRFIAIEQRLSIIEHRLSTVESQVVILRRDLNELDIKVSNTYQLALDAWGTSTENRHWLINSKLPT